MAHTHTLSGVQPAAAAHAAGLAPLRWPWPLPALAVWLGCWALWAGLVHMASLALAAGVAAAAGGLVAVAWPQLRLGRRLWLALGFPLSMFASGMSAGVWAGWWLLPLGLLLVLYPVRAWGDAPLFPTPHRALEGLAARIPLAPGARVLDAGCGVGDGLKALAGEWPRAELHGVEWSPALALAARWRCRDAQVRRGDLWADDWAGYDLVYLFQRPETMPRAWAKACAEMRPGTWLLSLDFVVPGVRSQWRGRCEGGRSIWAYRVPGGEGDRAPSRF